MKIKLTHCDILSGEQNAGTIEINDDKDLRQKLTSMNVNGLGKRDSSGIVEGYVLIDKIFLNDLNEDTPYEIFSGDVPKTQAALVALNK